MNFYKAFINILIFLIFFLALDIFLFLNITNFEIQRYFDNLSADYTNFHMQKFDVNFPYQNRGHKYLFNEKNQNNKAIVFTGCSFIYGVGLKENQTLPYKVAQISQQPVYNIAIPGGGLSQLLFMVETGIFDENLSDNGKRPYIGSVVYNYGDFHIQRLMIPALGYKKSIILYKKKGNDLVLKKSQYIPYRFTIPALLNEKLFFFLSQNSNLYKKYMKDMLYLHFTKINNELKKKYTGVKFVILVYQISPIFNEIEQDLKQEGIHIIKMYDDLHKNIWEQKYLLEDGHPSELIWNETAEDIYLRLEKIMNK